MQIETKKVRNGEFDGQTVWICHYNHPDLNKKPLRNVPPTKVLIRPLSDLPKTKNVYYSESYFSPVSSTGKVLARIISPVDNTGYRMYCGNELFVFDCEDDCRYVYGAQIRECIKRVDIEIQCAAEKEKKLKKKLMQMLSSTASEK